MDSALIVMTFQQDLPYQNDSTSIDLVGHMVRRDNLTGTFEADGGFVPTSLAPGAPMARVQTDNGYYLSCVLFR
jgi:hypothetical protein